MTDSLRIHKREVSAALFLTNATVLRGEVYLSEYSTRMGKPQTVGDLVAENEPMLPMKDRTGRFVLVGRHSIVAAEVSLKEAEDHGSVFRVPVHLETTSGHRFDGTFLIEEGAGRRIMDVLNTTDPWVQLQTHTAHVWVSRRHILTARPDGA